VKVEIVSQVGLLISTGIISGNGGVGVVKIDGHVVGIDLGTTDCGVAIYREGCVELIPNENGHFVTPSVVHATPD
jgi:hypothetical protein